MLKDRPMSEFSWRIGHLEHLESPWGNAGGVVKTIEDVAAMTKTGVGWIEHGSTSLDERAGYTINPITGEHQTVYCHNPTTGETGNCRSLDNPGMDKAEKDIPEMVAISHANSKKLIANVVPVTGDPMSETRELVSRAYEAGADAVLLNPSCPNTEIEMLSDNLGDLKLVLDGLRKITERFAPIFIRLAPSESYDHKARVLSVAKNSSVVSAVFDTNTWGGYKPLDDKGRPILQSPDGTGGKSGPAVANDAIEQVRWTNNILGQNRDISLVMSIGIMDARTLLRGMQAGADAGAGTTFYYQSKNGWEEDTNKLLHDLVKQQLAA